MLASNTARRPSQFAAECCQIAKRPSSSPLRSSRIDFSKKLGDRLQSGDPREAGGGADKPKPLQAGFLLPLAHRHVFRDSLVGDQPVDGLALAADEIDELQRHALARGEDTAVRYFRELRVVEIAPLLNESLNQA